MPHGHGKKPACTSCHASSVGPRDIAEAVFMLVAVTTAYMVLSRTGMMSFTGQAGTVAGLGTVFLVGVIASLSSCLALVGGLLLSVSAKWCESHQGDTVWHKFQPLFLFNVGRLAGYFVLGGLAGLLGRSIGLSVNATGVLTIGIALVMLVLGLNILHLIPKKYCSLPLPRGLTRRIHGLTESDHPVAPMLLGALTFFVPCGFTQSMQLIALASGDFLSGGLIMLVFALGTLPALLGLSLVSSVAQGTFARIFFKFSGAVVVLLAVINLQSGLVLTGVDLPELLPGGSRAQATADPNVTIDKNGQQIISMYVTDQGYSPASFTIAAGKPTWVYAVSPKGVTNCASMLTAPAYGMSIAIKQGENWLGPIPAPKKDFTLACSMGMFKARIHVQG